MTSRYRSQLQLQALADRAAARSSDGSRHRCFISYHVADQEEVSQFIEDFGDQFIGTAVGVTEDDDFVDSDDMDYVMEQIRKKHLGNTTVTMVLVGECTWSRKFVDWEVYASLRKYEAYAPSGLVAINLPSMGKTGKLPGRVADNRNGEEGYARYWVYPSSRTSLRNWIDIAFDARSTKTHLIDNSRARRQRNSTC